MSRISVESHFAIEPGHQGVRERQVVVGRFSAHGMRKFADRSIGLRERCIAKIELGRKTLDSTAYEAIGVLRVDFAFHGDGQILERTFRRERMDNVAERVFVLMQQAILRQVDAPHDHMLPIMVARRQTQHLRHALRRLVIRVGGRVRYPDSHET